MKVKAIQNVLYKGEIYDKGQEFEIDDVTGRIFEKRGTVKVLSETVIEPEIEASAEGLPDLMTQNAGKKKK